MYNREERRETSRLQLKTPVTLSDNKNNTSFGTIMDLSATGALIRTTESLLVNKQYTLTIQLTGEHSKLLIGDLSVSIIRHEADQVGVKFTDKMEWLTIFYVYKSKCNQYQKQNK